MVTQHQLKYCNQCLNSEYDTNSQIMCGLTMQQPAFGLTCPHYNPPDNTENKFSAPPTRNNRTSIETELTADENFERIRQRINNLNLGVTSGKRLANYMLDNFFFIMFMIIVGLIASMFGLAGIVSDGNENFVSLLFYLLYYIIFEAALSQTPGKMITRTKVVTLDGAKPSFANIVGRTLCRLIPFEPLSFLGSNGTGWHDTITKTKLIAIENK